MDTATLIGLIFAVIVMGFAAWFAWRQLRTKRLREQFGPEYDRTVTRLNNREVAERELAERRKRVTKFKIVPLSPDEYRNYRTHWDGVQSQFVDDPQRAVGEAHSLIQEVMRKRGYPVADFEQSAADLSVEHPRVVENYRAAHAIAERNKRDAANPEDLRQALVYYRALFDDLLENKASRPTDREPSFVQRVKRLGSKRSTKEGGIRA